MSESREKVLQEFRGPLQGERIDTLLRRSKELEGEFLGKSVAVFTDTRKPVPDIQPGPHSQVSRSVDDLINKFSDLSGKITVICFEDVKRPHTK